MTIENKAIQHVLALATYRSFARAAQSLHLTQPALSRSISVLEGRLGVQLFDRTGSGVDPTAYGRLFIEMGAEIAMREKELVREMLLLKGVEVGELSIGAAPYPFDISATTAVSRLLSRFPKLKIQLTQGAPLEILDRVLTRKCDIGVADIRTLHDEPQIQLEPLPVHVGVFSCRPEHPLAGRKMLPVSDILAFPMAGSTFPPQLAEIFEPHLSAGTVDKVSRYFTCAVYTASLNCARQIAMESDVVLLAPIIAIEKQLRGGGLVVLDCHPNWMRTNYGFITKRDRTPSPATLEFMEVLRDIESKTMAKEDALLAEYVIKNK